MILYWDFKKLIQFHFNSSDFEQNWNVSNDCYSFNYLIDLQALELDISKQLAAYEVEYHVIQEEVVVASVSSAPASPKMHAEGSLLKSIELEESNLSLQKQVRELQAQLQRSKTNACLQEVRLKDCQSAQTKLERQVKHQSSVSFHSLESILVLKTLQQLQDCEEDRELLTELVADLMKRFPADQELIIPPRLAHCLQKLSPTDNGGLVMMLPATKTHNVDLEIALKNQQT